MFPAAGLALVRAPAVGWGSARTIGWLAGSAALLTAFVVNEQRSKNPLLPLSIFRVKGLAAADITQLIGIAGHRPPHHQHPRRAADRRAGRSPAGSHRRSHESPFRHVFQPVRSRMMSRRLHPDPFGPKIAARAGPAGRGSRPGQSRVSRQVTDGAGTARLA